MNTGRVRLIRTQLIRSFTLFEVSVKGFPIIFLSFHEQLIHISTYFEENPCRRMTLN